MNKPGRTWSIFVAAALIALIGSVLGGCLANDDVGAEATALEHRRPQRSAVPPGPERPTQQTNVGPMPSMPRRANNADDPPPPVPMRRMPR